MLDLNNKKHLFKNTLHNGLTVEKTLSLFSLMSYYMLFR